jgi:hypothetical protein
MTNFLNVEDRNLLLVINDLKGYNSKHFDKSLKNIEEQLGRSGSAFYRRSQNIRKHRAI